MSAANPAMPPQMAVTAKPRPGSSSRMASSAPTTAPKNEAAHARKGVSSQPKMRKNRRTQRMGSGGALPEGGGDRSGDKPGQESYGKGAQRPMRAGEAEQNGEYGDDDRRYVCSQQPNRCRGAAISRGLIRQNPGAHPRQKAAYHPPDRMIPTVAPAADVAPAVSIGADILKQDDIHKKKDGGRAEADSRGA